ncbi:DUF1093 domain-containing protein [Paenibacillus sp. 481]|uniref:DUF1093 domain-containing protein n=1 Tax=Paenibacillus sp. 481 TaxID=2835869 RepID=UPI001E3EC1DC|nr:YxeA family protein [Paenibacillus sp. 481]UHA73205.1 YxeA family protein [Paenibacillus sp. 481]
MKKFSIIALLLVVTMLAAGCGMHDIMFEKYYVQVKGEGELKDNKRYYTLTGFSKNGTERSITFTSFKENNGKLKEGAFLALYVDQKDEKKKDVLDIEMKKYEEVQKDDLPSSVKKGLNVE